jgi:TolB protein
VALVTLRSNVPVDHLEIVGNGEVLRDIPLAGDRTRADIQVRLPVRASGWFLLRARSDRAMEPVLDLYPYATTSPIYVTVGAEPVRSPDDAEYFLRWIARLDTAAGASRDWNTDSEREEALTLIGRARSEFERRRGATN